MIIDYVLNARRYASLQIHKVVNLNNSLATKSMFWKINASRMGNENLNSNRWWDMRGLAQVQYPWIQEAWQTRQYRGKGSASLWNHWKIDQTSKQMSRENLKIFLGANLCFKLLSIHTLSTKIWYCHASEASDFIHIFFNSCHIYAAFWVVIFHAFDLRGCLCPDFLSRTFTYLIFVPSQGQGTKMVTGVFNPSRAVN